MKNVSREFRNEMQKRRDFYYTVDFTFSDGETLRIGKEDLLPSGNGVVQSSGSSSFPLGSVVSKTITLKISNIKNQFQKYNFFGSSFWVYLNFDLSSRIEIISMGKFTVIEPEEYGNVITLTGMDDTYKLDKEYTTKLQYPISVGAALRDSLTSCGMDNASISRFNNDDFVINVMPTGITHRAFVGLCAMIAGGNAILDHQDRISIKMYDFSGFGKTNDFYGGLFDSARPYETGDNWFGGIFNPWETGEALNIGTFSDMKSYHVFYNGSNLSMATDNVIITGVKSVAEKTSILYGAEGYVLQIENQLIAGKEQEALKRIGDAVIGLEFRPFTFDNISYPIAEFGDLCYVTGRDGRTYKSVITEVDFSFRGFTVLKCTADSPIRNNNKYASKAEVNAIVASREETKKEIGNYDIAVQQLSSLITQSFGIFKTEEVLEDGSTIFYMHDKPNLTDSLTIWRMAANVLSVSTDGGKTWNAGIDSQGNAVVNVLSAIGIRFDWAEGGVIKIGGLNNKSGYIEVTDNQGKRIGGWTDTGLYIDNSSSFEARGLNKSGGRYISRVNPQWLEFSFLTDALIDNRIMILQADEMNMIACMGEICSEFKLAYTENKVIRNIFIFNRNSREILFDKSVRCNSDLIAAKNISVEGVIDAKGGINIESDLDLKYNQIEHANILKPNIYSPNILDGANMNGSTMKNINVDSTLKTNGKTTYTGTINIENGMLGTKKQYTHIKIENGLITNFYTDTSPT